MQGKLINGLKYVVNSEKSLGNAIRNQDVKLNELNSKNLFN